MIKSSKNGRKEKPPNLAYAAQVAKVVEIKDIQFLEFGARHKPELIVKPMTVILEVNTKTQLEKKGNEIVVHVIFILYAGGKEKERAVEIRLTLRLRYVAKSKIAFNNEYIDSFGHFNGIYNAWPYWREFVQSSTARMNLPPLVLPVYRIK
jgi:preprotein translocase subunit SecB